MQFRQFDFSTSIEIQSVALQGKYSQTKEEKTNQDKTMGDLRAKWGEKGEKEAERKMR